MLSDRMTVHGILVDMSTQPDQISSYLVLCRVTMETASKGSQRLMDAKNDINLYLKSGITTLNLMELIVMLESVTTNMALTQFKVVWGQKNGFNYSMK